MSAQLAEDDSSPKKNGLMPILAITPATLLQMAVQQGADLTKLEKLMDLQERWEANQARKAFVEDMAAFKANPPDIFKTNHVKFGNTEYMHATLANVTDAVCIGLANHNLSHRWQVEQKEGRIAVICIITHVQGHSESVRLESSADTSGGKNSIQAIASAITYLERYTLLAACGLATKDMQDDDGAGADAKQPEYLSEDFADWRGKIDECNTQEEFAAVWREMTPGTRSVMAPYVKEKKSAKLGAVPK